MWENETKQQSEQIMPPGAELREALAPPRLPKEKQNPNYMLRVQLALCALALLAVFVMRFMQTPLYGTLRDAYQAALEQGVSFSGQEELIKFASGALEDVQQKAQEVMGQLEGEPGEAPAELTGAGGYEPSKWPVTPIGSSLKSYLPPFDLAQPITGYSVTSGYGWRKHPVTKKSDFHTGIDLAMDEGTPIHPSAEGIVLKSEYSASYGNNVLVLHQDGVATRYCHMQYVFVRQGEPVNLQTVLGTVGQTGMVTGPHLHFELLHDDLRYSPAAALGLA